MRKYVKRIDPRYFLNETVNRDRYGDGRLNEAQGVHEQEAAAALFADWSVQVNMRQHISFRDFMENLGQPNAKEILDRYGYTAENIPGREMKIQFGRWQEEANMKRNAGDPDALVRMRHPVSKDEIHFDVKPSGEVLRVK